MTPKLREAILWLIKASQYPLSMSIEGELFIKGGSGVHTVTRPNPDLLEARQAVLNALAEEVL